jgi:thiamine-phosphate pyrophosphorylase
VAQGSAVPLKGLYIVLDSSCTQRRPLLQTLHEAAEAGARLFQYRNKSGSMLQAYEEGLTLRRAAAERGALFIVNDRCDLALALEADGVHLGQADLPLAEARAIMGSHHLIGISTHRPEQVEELCGTDADYVAFGPIFRTSSKPDHEPIVGLEGLRRVRPLTRLPLFAIGGITPENVSSVITAGADGVAVISAILDAPDVGTTVRALMK